MESVTSGDLLAVLEHPASIPNVITENRPNTFTSDFMFSPLCRIQSRRTINLSYSNEFYPYIRGVRSDSQRQASIPSLHTEHCNTCLTLLRSCTVDVRIFLSRSMPSIPPSWNLFRAQPGAGGQRLKS